MMYRFNKGRSRWGRHDNFKPNSGSAVNQLVLTVARWDRRNRKETMHAILQGQTSAYCTNDFDSRTRNGAIGVLRSFVIKLMQETI